MKTTKRIAIIILAIALLSPVAYAADKVGYLNLSRAFDEHHRTAEFDASLEKEGREKSEEREKMVDDIRRLKDEMELLSAEGKESKRVTIDEKVRELQKFDTETRQMMRKKRDDMVGQILDEIKDTVVEYGKAKGYSIIINDRIVLYSDGKNDVTDEIIKKVNG